MSGGPPRTAIGTYGEIRTWAVGGRYVAETRYLDLDERLWAARPRRPTPTNYTAPASEVGLGNCSGPDLALTRA